MVILAAWLFVLQQVLQLTGTAEAKVPLNEQLVQALSSRLSKSSSNKNHAADRDFRIIVAFSSELDTDSMMEMTKNIFLLEKGANSVGHESGHEKALLASQELFTALGDAMVDAIAEENAELEAMLLEIVSEDQIVRRLPIGNSFVLTGLTMEQAVEIADMDRTALLTLSVYKPINDAPRRKMKSGSRFTSTRTNTNTHSRSRKAAAAVHGNPFDDEPVSEIRSFNPSLLLLEKSANQNVQWNVQKCGATEVWAQGVKGAGIIYGVIDSGVSFRHPILKNSYLGYDAEKQTFNHDWAWYDGVRAGPKSKEEEELTTPPATDAEGKESNENGHSAGTDGRLKQDTFNMTSTNDKNVLDVCRIPSNEPCDSIGHGTHVLSTAVGGYGFGVAPDAKWIACRSIARDHGRDEDSLACLNFMLAPHARDGTRRRSDLRPHVIGNSYGWPSWREVQGAGIDLAVKRLEAAGTVMVFAAGNSGPQCGTIYSGFGFTVGATDASSRLAHFSSRGPWYERRGVPGRQYLIKPELVAPGHEIHGAYGSAHAARMSGTSMAAPLVAGSVALLLQACPDLVGKPGQVLSLLQETARPMKVPFGTVPCGRDNHDSLPNNHYGNGEIDVKAAIAKCKQQH